MLFLLKEERLYLFVSLLGCVQMAQTQHGHPFPNFKNLFILCLISK